MQPEILEVIKNIAKETGFDLGMTAGLVHAYKNSAQILKDHFEIKNL